MPTPSFGGARNLFADSSNRMRKTLATTAGRQFMMPLSLS